MQQIVETETGVYQPFSLKSGMAHVLVLSGLVIAALVLARAFQLTLLLAFMALFRMVIQPLLERRKYGKLGKPAIALREGMLFVALPGDSRGHVSMPLADLRQVIVYGLDGRRRYRLVRADGTFVEAAPIWQRRVEDAAIRFLQRRVSAVTQVIVKEPQSYFSYIRGECP